MIGPALRLLPLLVCPALSIGLAAAQQLPPAPGEVPQLRRGADGQLEVVQPPSPQPPLQGTQTTGARPVPRPRPQQRSPVAESVASAPPVASVPDVARLPEPENPRQGSIALPDLHAFEVPAGAREIDPVTPTVNDLPALATSGNRVLSNELSAKLAEPNPTPPPPSISVSVVERGKPDGVVLFTLEDMLTFLPNLIDRLRH